MKGGDWPYWFLGDNEWKPLNNGAYVSAPNSYLQQNLQLIYVCAKAQGQRKICVNTPYVDDPNIYSVWTTKRHGPHEAIYCRQTQSSTPNGMSRQEHLASNNETMRH